MSPTIKVCLADSNELLEEVFAVRRAVFVDEQQVDPADEFDAYESSCRHFLGYCREIPCASGRWRETAQGIKLERFAVLTAYRKQGVASALMAYLLDDVFTQHGKGTYLYLHAQLTAVPLYEKFGFKKVGGQFEECQIQHYKMERTA